MPARRLPRSIAVAVLAASLAAAWPAASADLPQRIAIHSAIDGRDPCADAGVLGQIRTRFDQAERRTWKRGLTMAAIGNGRSSHHPFAEPGLIRRDYCMADARMSDSTVRSAYFAIEYGAGFASIGNYVDWCVAGLDPWRVHDEDCRTVR